MKRTSPALYLKSSPLVYVLAQVVISPILSMPDYIPAIQEKLRHKGYIKYKHAPTQEIILGPQIQLSALNRWFFTDRDEQKAVIISPQFIVIETTNYETFDTFMQSFKEVLLIFKEITNASLAERIGLRYVDVIRPKEGQALSDYLQPGLLGIPAEQFGGSKSLYRLEANAITPAGALVLRLFQSDNGSYLPPDISLESVKPKLQIEQGETVTVLDIDHFSLQEHDFVTDDLVESMWQLHNYTDRAFKAAVTSKALQIWEAENVTNSTTN
ncbi:MAG TPA: TIGR04255 family protein [Leptolyngbyaceae cyanobacterium]